MTRIHDLQTAFEVWAVIFALIAGICVFATRSSELEAASSLIRMLVVVSILIQIIRNRRHLRRSETAAFCCNLLLMAAGFVLHLFVTEIDFIVIA